MFDFKIHAKKDKNAKKGAKMHVQKMQKKGRNAKKNVKKVGVYINN